MSIRQRLRTIACCAILQLAALVGMPMRPEEVQDLMRMLNQPKVARTDPDERRKGDDPRTAPARTPARQHPFM
jgi:hypothetical protein